MKATIRPPKINPAPLVAMLVAVALAGPQILSTFEATHRGLLRSGVSLLVRLFVENVIFPAVWVAIIVPVVMAFRFLYVYLFER